MIFGNVVLSCKKFCDKDRQSIMDFISIFENEPIEEVRDHKV